MSFPLALLAFLRDLLIAIADVLMGRRHRRYETSVFVKAPAELVWEVVRSRDITLDGVVAQRFITDDVPGHPGFERVRVITAGTELIIMLRVVDERANAGLLLEVIPEGTDPRVVMGSDDRIGYALMAHDGGTVLYLSRELTRTRARATMIVPLGLRSAAKRYKAKAEMLAAVPQEARQAAKVASQPPSGTAGEVPNGTAAERSGFGLTTNGLVLGIVALASFSYLWGLEMALLVAAIIILHELGHAAAMIMVGIPVKGVYLVPFFGGAAIAGAPYRSEAQIGFVALMGPGFSLISTFAMAVAGHQSGSASLLRAAELSAIINLFNLVPIMPLDGGLVLKSALVSFSRTFAQGVGILAGVLGLYGAYLLGSPILAVFIGLGLLMTWQMKAGEGKETMSWGGAALLLAAFGATIASYLALIKLSNT